ncbi:MULTISPECIES: ATP-binding protein [Thermodesulfovibrio]|jgi:DNA helicase HerA-like ATPase|uniref:ATP-binding protein n=1 Tax=Thermodesulfovibrio TaxID=28261 RepID=UPI0026397152|nr:ATP-binding protein [Thermodesulfovibrio sp.]
MSNDNHEIYKTLFQQRHNRLIAGYLIDVNGSQCEIWFPYSIEVMKLLTKGAFLAAENFSSINLPIDDEISFLDNEKHFSILQITDKKAIYYKIQEMKNTPSSIKLEEDFEKLQKDWNRSLKEEESPNLKIQVFADITDYEIKVTGNEYLIKQNEMEPIQGYKVYLLNNEIVEQVINKGIIKKKTIFPVGLHKFYNVNVFIDYNSLINRHFGIFATTGAGKSNLVSSLFSYLMYHSEENTNIVVFDVNNEYITLLSDCLAKINDTHVIILEESYLGKYANSFLKGNLSNLELAAQEITDSIVIPSSLKTYKDKIREIVRFLLSKGVFKMFVEGESIEKFLFSFGQFLKNNITVGRGSKVTKQKITSFVEFMREKIQDTSINITKTHLNYINTNLRDWAEEYFGSELIQYCETYLQQMNTFINKFADEFKEPSDYLFSIGREGLFKIVSDNEKSLVIVLSDNDNTLRYFASYFIDFMYNFRKSRGITSPPILFFFDEADLFIPGSIKRSEEEESSSIKKVKESCQMLARRGRKYGMGLGLATQRIAYNDTNVLAQLNTYFVGKLMRKTDRQIITESYGISEGAISETVGFGPGDWTLLSTCATGIRNTPIAIHMENSEDRIKNFIEEEWAKLELIFIKLMFEKFVEISKDERIFEELNAEIAELIIPDYVNI